MGKGEQETKAVVENERIDAEVRFLKPFKAVGFTRMTTRAAGDRATLVSWGMSGNSKYPMNLMTQLMKKALDKDLETSLATLKETLEK